MTQDTREAVDFFLELVYLHDCICFLWELISSHYILVVAKIWICIMKECLDLHTV